MQSFGYTPPSFWTAIPPDRTVLSKYDAAKVRCRLLVARHQQALSPGQCDPRSARFPEMASASPVQVEWRQSVGRTNRRDPPAAGVPAHGGHPNIPSVRPDLNTAAHSYTHTLLPPQRQQCQPPPSAAAQKRGGRQGPAGPCKGRQWASWFWPACRQAGVVPAMAGTRRWQPGPLQAVMHLSNSEKHF